MAKIGPRAGTERETNERTRPCYTYVVLVTHWVVDERRKGARAQNVFTAAG